MKLSRILLAAVLAFGLSGNVLAADSITEIRRYQIDLSKDIDSGVLKRIPKRFKTDLAQRNAELAKLTGPDYAQADAARRAKVDELYAELRSAVQRAELEVVTCQRTSKVGTRLAKTQCMTKREQILLREKAREELREAHRRTARESNN